MILSFIVILKCDIKGLFPSEAIHQRHSLCDKLDITVLGQ